MPKGVKGFQKGNTAYINRQARRTAAQIEAEFDKAINKAMADTAEIAIADFQKAAEKEYFRVMRIFYNSYRPKKYKRNYTLLKKKYTKRFSFMENTMLIGGIELVPEDIPSGTYRNLAFSENGKFKPGDPFPGTLVFAYAYDIGYHGADPEAKLSRVAVAKTMMPPPATRMKRWNREYVNNKQIGSYLMNDVFMKRLSKYAKQIKRSTR